MRIAHKTTEVRSRIEPALKNKVVRYLNKYDMSLSHAIRLFMLEIIEHRGLPFDLRLRPGDREAIDEVEYAIKNPDKVKSYGSVEEMLKDIDKD